MKERQKSKGDVLNHLNNDLDVIKRELKHDVTPAVVASFGFIIALIWRDAIKSAIDEFLSRAGLLDKAYLYNFVSAIIVTVVVILIMIAVSKFGKKKRVKKVKKAIEKMEELADKKKSRKK